jgi:hypothetical protein
MYLRQLEYNNSLLQSQCVACNKVTQFNISIRVSH